MILRKWNYQKHDYEPYEVPDSWNITDEYFTELDLDKEQNCASCGKIYKTGDMFTSKEIHNYLGLGYSVCEECHNKEMLRKYNNKKIYIKKTINSI